MPGSSTVELEQVLTQASPSGWSTGRVGTREEGANAGPRPELPMRLAPPQLRGGLRIRRSRYVRALHVYREAARSAVQPQREDATSGLPRSNAASV